MKATDALGLAVELGQELEAAKLPYAIGGALALGVHGVSRATQDVDVNVFVTGSDLERLLDLLVNEGVQLDRSSAREEATRDGFFYAWAGSVRLDVFLPSIDLSWEALRTRVSIVVEGTATWFLSVEMVCCFKLLFFRPKDLADLERLVPSNATLNVVRVRQLIAETMGEDDERVRAWDEIVRRATGGAR